MVQSVPVVTVPTQTPIGYTQFSFYVTVSPIEVVVIGVSEGRSRPFAALLWAWNRPHEELCDRSDSPWDDAERRPSHANRRKALRELIIQKEINNHHRRLAATAKNHSTGRTPRDAGRLTQFKPPNVQISMKLRRFSDVVHAGGSSRAGPASRGSRQMVREQPSLLRRQ